MNWLCHIFGHSKASGWVSIERLFKNRMRMDWVAVCKRCNAEYSTLEGNWRQ
jgi:hypothetical protein